MVILHNLTCAGELPKVTIERERITVPPVIRLEVDQGKHPVAGLEESVRLKAGDLKRRERFEEAGNSGFPTPGLEPRHTVNRNLCLPLNVFVELVQDRGHISSAERLINLLDRVDVAHRLG